MFQIIPNTYILPGPPNPVQIATINNERIWIVVTPVQLFSACFVCYRATGLAEDVLFPVLVDTPIHIFRKDFGLLCDQELWLSDGLGVGPSGTFTVTEGILTQ